MTPRSIVALFGSFTLTITASLLSGCGSSSDPAATPTPILTATAAPTNTRPPFPTATVNATASGTPTGLPSATTTPTTTSAQLSDYFKSTDWVAQHAGDASFVIVDTRAAAAYNAGHVPGAINIPRTKFYFPRRVIDPASGTHKFSSTQLPVWDPATNAQKLDASSQPVWQWDAVVSTLPQYFVTIAYDIPTPAELVDILTNNGITPDTTVVAYDNDTSSYGGRLPWVLKVYGHQKAYVIDGGIDKWKDVDGRPLSTTTVTPAPSAKPYEIASYQNHRITKSDLAAVVDTTHGNITKAGYVISDVRTPSEYAGFATTVTSGAPSTGTWSVSTTPFVYSVQQGARPGHVPNARFSDYTSDAFADYINPSAGKPVPSTLQANHNVQVLKSAAALRAHFESLGITPDKTVYNYCEGGFRSGVYTLIQLGLGYPNVYNYDGSWNEWSIQGSLYPIETGDARATTISSGTAVATPTKTATPATGNAQLSDYFKSTDWVAQHASDANFVIVDTRPAANYSAGHIPGAINIPRTKFYFPRKVIDVTTGTYEHSPTQLPVWDPATNAQKLDASSNPVWQWDTVIPTLSQYFVTIAYDIPTPAELIDILTNNGVTPDTTVVAYDNDTSSYGGRVPWVLKVYGHEKAYVIDGGIDKWKDADGRPLSTTAVVPTPSAQPYKIASYQNHRVIKSDVAAVIDTAHGNVTKAGYVISDVRTPSEYTGFATTVTSGAPSTGTWSVSTTPFVYSVQEAARPGHIPYAKFSDYASDAFEDYINPSTGKPVPSTLQANHNVQVLKSAAALRAHFESLGITPDKTVYNYCEGGFRSGVYTLIQLGLGYPNVYNYDGSWNAWSIQGSAYPVVTGDGRLSGE